MSLSTRVAAQLPYLRRYARAISGSQASGDAYVEAMLEALIAKPSILTDGGNDRVALYKLFASLFGSLRIEINTADSPYAWERHAAGNLETVPRLNRQAFLLVTVEEFSPDEAADILSIDADALARLVAEASDEISRQMATDILIIEDDPLIAMDIEQMVTELGHNPCGIARTHAEAVELFARTRPRMVLADIQLADGSSGIDAVNDILETEAVPVIFITAFPERLLTGERPEPAFLVTKPFNPDMVKALIGQALFFGRKAQAAA